MRARRAADVRGGDEIIRRNRRPEKTAEVPWNCQPLFARSPVGAVVLAVGSPVPSRMTRAGRTSAPTATQTSGDAVDRKLREQKQLEHAERSEIVALLRRLHSARLSGRDRRARILW